jgi:hypothetical protein
MPENPAIRDVARLKKLYTIATIFGVSTFRTLLPIEISRMLLGSLEPLKAHEFTWDVPLRCRRGISFVAKPGDIGRAVKYSKLARTNN